MEREEFYGAVASIIGVPDEFREPRQYRRRWGQRQPGNGRFVGFGVIRWFGPRMIHVALENPESIIKTFDSPEAALNALRTIFELGTE